MVLPSDGLLLAKVRGEPAALQAAQQCRAEAIASVRRATRTGSIGDPLLSYLETLGVKSIDVPMATPLVRA
jgi:hypothetical protein